jgi:hypothetical protein
MHNSAVDRCRCTRLFGTAQVYYGRFCLAWQAAFGPPHSRCRSPLKNLSNFRRVLRFLRVLLLASNTHSPSFIVCRKRRSSSPSCRQSAETPSPTLLLSVCSMTRCESEDTPFRLTLNCTPLIGRLRRGIHLQGAPKCRHLEPDRRYERVGDYRSSSPSRAGIYLSLCRRSKRKVSSLQGREIGDGQQVVRCPTS